MGEPGAQWRNYTVCLTWLRLSSLNLHRGNSNFCSCVVIKRNLFIIFGVIFTGWQANLAAVATIQPANPSFVSLYANKRDIGGLESGARGGGGGLTSTPWVHPKMLTYFFRRFHKFHMGWGHVHPPSYAISRTPQKLFFVNLLYSIHNLIVTHTIHYSVHKKWKRFFYMCISFLLVQILDIYYAIAGPPPKKKIYFS